MKPASGSVPPIDEQRAFWNRWNAQHREGAFLDDGSVEPESLRRGRTVLEWVRALPLRQPEILEIGCGTGWLAAALVAIGSVTAVDLADEVLRRAQARYPRVTFVAGDFLHVTLPDERYDLAVSVETLSSVADQPAFVGRIARLVKPGGYLVITTHNKFVYDRCSDVDPLQAGQIRHWSNRRELRQLLAREFQIMRLRTILLRGHGGILHLVNSYKLADLARRLGRGPQWEDLRERWGFGETFVVLARRRGGGPTA